MSDLPDPGADAGNLVQPTIYFDRDGDLCLEVGPREVPFIVCPRSVSRASPVFKQMLYGHFAEARPAHGDWIVRLPEDDPVGLEVLLNIIHCRIAEIPEQVNTEILFSIITLADKYDLLGVLKPWPELWLGKLHDGQSEGSAESSCLTSQRLRISWLLGDVKTFERGASHLARHCRVNDDGEIIYSGGEMLRWDRILVTMDIFDSLKLERRRLFDSLLRPVKQLLKSLLRSRQRGPRRCRLHTFADSDLCNVSILGHLVLELTKLELFPLPKAEDYPKDLWSLYNDLDSIKWCIDSAYD